MSRRRAVRSRMTPRPPCGPPRSDCNSRDATALASGPRRAFRADAGRASGLARTPVDQLARARDERLVHAEQRLAEADAARVVVVEKDRRRRPTAPADRRPSTSHPPSRRRPRSRRRPTRRDRACRTSAAAARRCASHTPGRARRRADPPCRTAASPSRARDRQPVRRRVHLLLGQIQLARPDVLVRVELDLLEPDDARHDVHLAVRAHRWHAMIEGLGRRSALSAVAPSQTYRASSPSCT